MAYSRHSRFTYHAAIVRVRDRLAVEIGSPQPDFCSGVPRLHAVQITEVCLVGSEDVREPPEVRLLNLSGRVLDGDLVLPDVEPVELMSEWASSTYEDRLEYMPSCRSLLTCTRRDLCQELRGLSRCG